MIITCSSELARFIGTTYYNKDAIKELAQAYYKEVPEPWASSADIDYIMVQIHKLAHSPRGLVIVMVDEPTDKVVGVYCGGIQESFHTPNLGGYDLAMFVHPEHRCKGIGIQLVNIAYCQFKKLNVSYILGGAISGVGENIPAIKTYESLNFIKVGDLFYKDI